MVSVVAMETASIARVHEAYIENFHGRPCSVFGSVQVYKHIHGRPPSLVKVICGVQSVNSALSWETRISGSLVYDLTEQIITVQVPW